ncbi:nuclear pore complex protein Nup98-Nup96-like [Microplitis mediator]|uniref:nuclear pore complex protein Nup98-Nup96-like n=1 Tax=Microplitis mediator TaxID=375433 RepID=UPI0025559E20|nr:nuclear pore complex protein Nup98-Nup96-like [Microplitis mediator]
MVLLVIFLRILLVILLTIWLMVLLGVLLVVSLVILLMVFLVVLLVISQMVSKTTSRATRKINSKTISKITSETLARPSARLPARLPARPPARSRHPENTSFGRFNSATQSNPFSQTNTTAYPGLFGTQGGFRTGSNTESAIVGTPVKFNPVVGSDTMVKQSVTQIISTKHHCIMVMKEFKNKSWEKLRLEDDTAGMKGPSQSAPTPARRSFWTTAPGLFGQPQQSIRQTTPIGQTNTTASTGLFGTQEGFRTGTRTRSPIVGTSVKFNSVVGSDTTVKQGVTQTTSTNHHCITVMKESNNK